jgi:solute carrier family 8 (sodium/calcium exchanger)
MNMDLDNATDDLSGFYVSALEEVPKTLQYTNGYIEIADGAKICKSFVILPGMFMLNDNLMAIVYLLVLSYLFLGIAIVSDIFMEAIEGITSQTTTITIWDANGKVKSYIDVPIWNATVANLTLMALGSSAPEILLSVIGTLQDIEGEPSKLGPSTIVGSAAFNLLMISAVSILSVGEEPKKIFDTGVFAVTSVFSIFAYIWLYLALQEWSANIVETWEAWLTLIMFFLLIIISYAADRYNTMLEDRKKSK